MYVFCGVPLRNQRERWMNSEDISNSPPFITALSSTPWSCAQPTGSEGGRRNQGDLVTGAHGRLRSGSGGRGSSFHDPLGSKWKRSSGTQARPCWPGPHCMDSPEAIHPSASYHHICDNALCSPEWRFPTLMAEGGSRGSYYCDPQSTELVPMPLSLKSLRFQMAGLGKLRDKESPVPA